MPASKTGLVVIGLVLVLLLGGVAPVAAHTPSSDGSDGDDAPAHDHPEGDEAPGGAYRPPPPSGGFIVPSPDEGSRPDGAGSSPFSFYEGAWLHGSYGLEFLGNQTITGFTGDGEWLAWVDASANAVYAHNVAAGRGFHVDDAEGAPARPHLADGVVAWEARGDGTALVTIHVLATGETRVLTPDADARGRQRNPFVSGNLIAWEEYNGREWDVIVYDRRTGEETRVSDPETRDTDPVIVNGLVVWLTYRFNVWDLQWFDVATGERGAVSADRAMELAPVAAGRNVLFLQSEGPGSSWEFRRFDTETRSTHRTRVQVGSPVDFVGDGERVVYALPEAPGTAFVAVNLTTGHRAGVTGFIPVVENPVISGRTLHVPVVNGTRHALMTVDVNRHAFMEPPVIRIDNPAHGAALSGPARFAGAFLVADGWGEPVFFGYTVDGANFTHVEPGRTWTFTENLMERGPGTYTVRVQAHFADAPPVVARVDVVVPQMLPGVDVERAADGFYKAFVQLQYERYLASNPAILALLALALLTVALAGVRFWLKGRPRRVVIEYVPPPEEDWR